MENMVKTKTPALANKNRRERHHLNKSGVVRLAVFCLGVFRERDHLITSWWFQPI